MLGTITKVLLHFGFPVLKEKLDKTKYFSSFENSKHPEMDLGFGGFCLERCHIWYNKCCLKKAEIELNQRVFWEYTIVFPNVIILYNIFLNPKEELCLQIVAKYFFFLLFISKLCIVLKCTDVHAYFMDEISGGVNQKVRQEFCKQKSCLLLYLCIDN